MFEQGTATNLLREVEGVLVPAGTPISLPEGMPVQITQALGNSITLYVNGNLVRVAASEADALGLESFEDDPKARLKATEQSVMSELKKVFDPEIPVNVVDLGLIYDVKISDRDNNKKFINVTMTLTAPGCGMGPYIAQDVESTCLSFEDVIDAHIDVVFDPPWSQEMMTEEARLTLGLI